MTSIHISPDGKNIISAGSQDIKIWDAATLEPRAEKLAAHGLSFGMSIASVQFSPDGSMIVSAGVDGSIKVWSAGSCGPLDESCKAKWFSLELAAEKHKAHSGAVRSAHFSPDSKRIVSSSDDKSIAVWDAATLQLIANKPDAHKDMIWSVRFSPDGTQIVSGGWDKVVKVWSYNVAYSGFALTAALDLIAEETDAHNGPVLSAAFSPDSKTIVSAGAGSVHLRGLAHIKVWDAGALAGASATVAAAVAAKEAAIAETKALLEKSRANQAKAQKTAAAKAAMDKKAMKEAMAAAMKGYASGSEKAKLKAEEAEKAAAEEKEEL